MFKKNLYKYKPQIAINVFNFLYISQIYHIDKEWAANVCLSGTSEITLASLLSKKVFPSSNLPLRFCAASRCFRAEAKRNQKERGIFRYAIYSLLCSYSTKNCLQKLVYMYRNITHNLFWGVGKKEISHFTVLKISSSNLSTFFI